MYRIQVQTRNMLFPLYVIQVFSFFLCPSWSFHYEGPPEVVGGVSEGALGCNISADAVGVFHEVGIDIVGGFFVTNWSQFNACGRCGLDVTI